MSEKKSILLKSAKVGRLGVTEASPSSLLLPRLFCFANGPSCYNICLYAIPRKPSMLEISIQSVWICLHASLIECLHHVFFGCCFSFIQMAKIMNRIQKLKSYRVTMLLCSTPQITLERYFDILSYEIGVKNCIIKFVWTFFTNLL